MGWGTFFCTDISLSREIYNSQSDVEDAIKILNNDMNDLVSKIKMFAAVSLGEIIPIEWKDQPIEWMNNQINELFEAYDELKLRHYKLVLYLEYIKEFSEHKFENDHE